MSGVTGALLAGGVLLVGAGLVAWWTLQARRTLVVWMRAPGGLDAHAIRRVDLRAETPEVDSVRSCGPWPVADLRRDAKATRCPVCVQAVAKLERGGT